MYVYSNARTERNPQSLPNVEIVQLTAEEAAIAHQELYGEYLRRFPLATVNRGEHDRMISAMIEDLDIRGGWYYAYGFPGCLWDADPVGPYVSYAEAFAAMREEAN